MSATNVRLQRAMNLSVSEGALATVMGTLLGGIFLTGFAIQLGASQFQIGIMAALPTLCNAAQFVGASVLNRTGRAKQLCMLATWVSRLLWIPVLFVPSLMVQYSSEAQAWCVIGLVGTASALGSIGGLAWLDWTKRLIPAEQRINFLARRNLYNSGLSLAMSVAAAIVISCWQGAASQAANASTSGSTGGFVAVFALAMVCGLIGVILLGRIPAADCTERSTLQSRGRWHEPLRSPNFRRLLLGYSVWQFATQLAAPFYAVYMLQKLGVPFWAVTALATMGSLLALSLNGAWTKLKVHFGVRPVVLFATLGDLLLPLCWLFVHPQTFWLIVPLHAFALFNPPLAMGPNNLLLKTAPNRNSASYMAIFNALTGTIGAMGAMVGGWLAMTLQAPWQVGQVEFTGIHLVFVLSAIGKLAGFALLGGVHEEGALTLRDMLNSLVQRYESVLRPVRAPHLLRTASDEQAPAHAARPMPAPAELATVEQGDSSRVAA
jgi:hypothetical protein